MRNAELCTHDTTKIVTVIAPPTADFQTNAPQCIGSAVTFTNTSTTLHGQIVRWTWDFNDGHDTTIVYPGVPNVTHTFDGNAQQHHVRLTVKTSDSCTSFKERLILSSPSPVASFDYSPTLCPGENVHFTDLSQLGGGGPVTNWSWNFDDPLSGSFNTSSLQHPDHAFTSASQYHVRLIVKNAGNCTDTLIKPVDISPKPLAAFTFDTVCRGSETHFQDLSSSTPGSIVSRHWDFGDGTYSTAPNPRYERHTGVKSLQVT